MKTCAPIATRKVALMKSCRACEVSNVGKTYHMDPHVPAGAGAQKTTRVAVMRTETLAM
jgi:hypothetical protein